MGSSNPLLWLCWATFAAYLAFFFLKKILPELRKLPPEPIKPLPALPAWLVCEDGAPFDLQVRWFALRAGGGTVVGHLPRPETDEWLYLYLTDDEVLPDHAALGFDAAVGRHWIEAFDGADVRHNGERLESGDRPTLSDGDLLDLGRRSRFRFTLTGPEAE